VKIERFLTNGGDSTDMKTYLMKDANFTVGNSKNLTDDFNHIGVDIQRQPCLRLAVIQRGVKKVSIKTMKISMGIRPYEEGQEDPEDMEIDVQSLSSGMLDRMNLGAKNNNVKMMPHSDKFQPWEWYKHYENGLNRYHRPCIIFNFCGDNYSLPDKHYDTVNCWCGQDPLRQAIIQVRNKTGTEAGFECCYCQPTTVEAVHQAPEHQQQTETAVQYSTAGKVGSQFNIPTSEEPMKIVGGSSKNSKGSNTATVIIIENHGNYSLPYTIYTQLAAHFMVTGTLDGKRLIGCQVVHTEKRKARMFRGRKGNDEEYLLIQDAQGVTIAESVTSCSGHGKRKRLQNDTDDEDEDEDHACTGKRQRGGC
jgi:hypothetical protein